MLLVLKSNLPLPPLPPAVNVLLGGGDGGGEELDQSLWLLSESNSSRTTGAAGSLLPGVRLRLVQLRSPGAQLPQVRRMCR